MLDYICTGLFSLHVGSLFFGSNRSIIDTDKSRQGNNFPRVYFSEVIYLGLCTQVDHARDAVSECACSTWVLHHTHACGNVDGGVMLVPKLG
jgi:hypothetical protein